MKVLILCAFCFLFLSACFGFTPQNPASRFDVGPVSVNTAASRSSGVSESRQCQRVRSSAEKAERAIERSADKLEDAEDHLEDAEEDLEEVQDELDDLKDDNPRDDTAITAKEIEKTELKNDIDRYEDKIKKAEDDLEDDEDDLDDAERDIDRFCD